MHFFCVYVCFENRYNYVVPTYYMSGLVSYVILVLSAGSSTTVYNFNNFARISMLWGSMYIGVFILCYRFFLKSQKSITCKWQVCTQLGEKTWNDLAIIGN